MGSINFFSSNFFLFDMGIVGRSRYIRFENKFIGNLYLVSTNTMFQAEIVTIIINIARDIGGGN